MYFSSLFEKYSELKMLKAILNSQGGISVSALAESAKVGKGSASVFLRQLEKDGLLSKTEIRNVHLYTLNDLAILRQLKLTLTLMDIAESALVENLIESNETITSIVLYGSHASGTNDSKSDLDILLLVGNKRKVPSIEIEKKLGKPVSVESFTIADWKKTKRENAPFYDSVIRNHIVLWGGDLP